MDNEPTAVTPFVDEGIPCLHRFGRARRLAREKKRVGPDIGGCIAPNPDCAGIDDSPRVALDEMEKILLDCGGVGPRTIRVVARDSFQRSNKAAICAGVACTHVIVDWAWAIAAPSIVAHITTAALMPFRIGLYPFTGVPINAKLWPQVSTFVETGTRTLGQCPMTTHTAA